MTRTGVEADLVAVRAAEFERLQLARNGPTPTSSLIPRATVYVHLTSAILQGRGAARAEDLGALTRKLLVDLLGHHHLSLRPVIDLNEGMAADCFEVPAATEERLQLGKPADVFSFASSLSRRLDRPGDRPPSPGPRRPRVDVLWQRAA